MKISSILGHSKKSTNFNYDLVLNELNKDYNINGITRIGFTDKGYEVFIVTDDDLLSDIPHFHYRKKKKGKPNEFHTCIKITDVGYYHHLGNEDRLNKNQIDDLIKFLNFKPLNTKHFKSNWELLLFSWNTQNNNIIVNHNLEIPNYNKLIYFK